MTYGLGLKVLENEGLPFRVSVRARHAGGQGLGSWGIRGLRPVLSLQNIEYLKHFRDLGLLNLE